MATHLAAVAVANGRSFELQTRPTPKPGHGELLIAVKSVALNPADCIMQESGIFIQSYPTVIGFDIAGMVVEVGDGVPVHGTERDGLYFQPGITRVVAYAAAVWRHCSPDFGAFQERCIVPWQHAVPLPADDISWNDAATLPVSVAVPLSIWDMMGIPCLGKESDRDVAKSSTKDISSGSMYQDSKGRKRLVLLIWGASSSVGTMGVQSARVLRDANDSIFGAVYATAGPANENYIRSLGADRLFD